MLEEGVSLGAWLFAHAISTLKHTSSAIVMLMAVLIVAMLNQFMTGLSLSIINLNAFTLLGCCRTWLAPFLTHHLNNYTLAYLDFINAAKLALNVGKV
jgi:hypothetical protein